MTLSAQALLQKFIEPKNNKNGITGIDIKKFEKALKIVQNIDDKKILKMTEWYFWENNAKVPFYVCCDAKWMGKYLFWFDCYIETFNRNKLTIGTCPERESHKVKDAEITVFPYSEFLSAKLSKKEMVENVKSILNLRVHIFYPQMKNILDLINLIEQFNTGAKSSLFKIQDILNFIPVVKEEEEKVEGEKIKEEEKVGEEKIEEKKVKEEKPDLEKLK